MKAIQFLLMAAIVFLSSANVLAQKDPAKAGEELMKKKKYAEAISAFSEAIKLEPK